MEAIEFQTKIDTLANISIPKEYQHKFKNEQDVRVILLINNKERVQDNLWNELTTKQFFSGYSEKDSIYDSI